MKQPRLREITKVHLEPGYEIWTVRRLRRARTERRIPTYKIAGRVMADLNDLDAAADSARCEAIASTSDQ